MNRTFPVGSGRHGRRLARLALPLACLLPLAVSARVEVSSDGGGDNPSGDPLDGNDCGSGGGSGISRPDDPRWPYNQSVVWPGPVVDGRRVLLIPVNEGGLLTFRLVIVDERVPTPEVPDAR